MIRLSDFLPVLALATSASLHLAAAPAHDKSQVVVPTESLVRVVVEQETSAILMGADYQARQKIQERASFDGFVLDSKAHVVLFVGEYRPSLRASKVRFTVLTHEGKAYQAQAVGLDDRISVAIVRAPIPGAVPLELASNPSFKHFNVASPGDSACPPAVACLLAGNSQDWLPFSVLKVSGLGIWAKRCPVQGTLALDPKGKLVGFVTDASPHRYNDRIAYTYVLPSSLIASSVDTIVSRGESIPGGWLGIYLASPYTADGGASDPRQSGRAGRFAVSRCDPGNRRSQGPEQVGPDPRCSFQGCQPERHAGCPSRQGRRKNRGFDRKPRSQVRGILGY